LQEISNPPRLGIWLTPVGQAYRFRTTSESDGMVVVFNYLHRDVPEGQEYGLAIYYLDDDDANATWQRLTTHLDEENNFASAKMPGQGLYALLSTIEMPPFTKGWNSFGYVVRGTRNVREALASIEGNYTAVYRPPQDKKGWTMFHVMLADKHPQLAEYLNDLDVLEFGKTYWIKVKRDTDFYFGVYDGNARLEATADTELPPNLVYGYVNATDNYAPEVGTTLTAYVGDTVCGETTIDELDGQLVYKLQVTADNALNPNNCGNTGRVVRIQDGERTVGSYTWNADQDAIMLILGKRYMIYLPLISR
jgi:hypothetical protein